MQYAYCFCLFIIFVAGIYHATSHYVWVEQRAATVLQWNKVKKSSFISKTKHIKSKNKIKMTIMRATNELNLFSISNYILICIEILNHLYFVCIVFRAFACHTQCTVLFYRIIDCLCLQMEALRMPCAKLV